MNELTKVSMCWATTWLRKEMRYCYVLSSGQGYCSPRWVRDWEEDEIGCRKQKECHHPWMSRGSIKHVLTLLCMQLYWGHSTTWGDWETWTFIQWATAVTRNSKKKEMNLSSREQGFLIMALSLKSCVTSGTLLPPHLQFSPCQSRAGLTASWVLSYI